MGNLPTSPPQFVDSKALSASRKVLARLVRARDVDGNTHRRTDKKNENTAYNRLREIGGGSITAVAVAGFADPVTQIRC